VTTTTVNQRPVLDEDGNINIQASEGLNILFKRGSLVNGSYVYANISAATYNLVINGPSGLITVACVNGADVYEKYIRASTTDLLPLVIGTAYDYAVIDTSGAVPVSRLEGKIKLRGFR
jgi:hypothetical protein